MSRLTCPTAAVSAAWPASPWRGFARATGGPVSKVAQANKPDSTEIRGKENRGAFNAEAPGKLDIMVCSFRLALPAQYTD
jgi:hypothetical protein